MSHWFDATHPVYNEWEPKWVYTQDHYNAEILDKLDTYLQKRAMGEASEAYEERKNISDYTPFFGHIADTLAGYLYAVDDKTIRVWQDEGQNDGLGDPDEADTIAHAIQQNADGRGMNWGTLWKQATIDLVVNQWLWVLVEGQGRRDMPTRTRLLNPVDVIDWVDDESGRLVQVKVRDQIYDRSSIQDLAEYEDCCFVYFLDGWTQYKREVKTFDDPRKDDEVTIREIDGGPYYYEDSNGNQTLPIRRFKLPLRRYVGYNLAKKNNAIFNKESAKDFLEWVACFPRLNVVGKDELYEKVVEKLKEGSSVLQNDPDSSNTHDYIAPATAPAEKLQESLKQKVEHFLYVAFQQYSDSARERTATEVRQDLSKGIGAFLQLLAGTVDEAENFAFWITEQTYFPARSFDMSGEEVTVEEMGANRQIWGQAKVERTTDFMPIDVEKRITALKDGLFGMETVPADKTAILDAVKEWLDHYNINYEEEELQQVIESRQARKTRSSDFDRELKDIVNGS